MEFILKEFINKFCIIYIDDILVFSDNYENHLDHLRQIFTRMNEYGLTTNEKKVELFKDRIEFLGREYEGEKIRPTVDKVQGIKDYAPPRNVKEVRRFLGMINYNRKFIPNITNILSPLYELTDKSKKTYNWTPIHQTAFENAKKALIDYIELNIQNSRKKFTLETDASDIGLGAILKQGEQIITFISKNLSPAERNYYITEREVLAALWAMEKLEFYLGTKEFSLITDHKAIEEIKIRQNFGSARVQR